MEEFNEYYALAQKMLGDEKVSTLVAVFDCKVKLCDRDKLAQQICHPSQCIKDDQRK
jgi:hypothetical protein